MGPRYVRREAQNGGQDCTGGYTDGTGGYTDGSGRRKQVIARICNSQACPQLLDEENKSENGNASPEYDSSGESRLNQQIDRQSREQLQSPITTTRAPFIDPFDESN